MTNGNGSFWRQFSFSLLLYKTLLTIVQRFLRPNMCGQGCMSIEATMFITYDKAYKQISFVQVYESSKLYEIVRCSSVTRLQPLEIFGWCSRNLENLEKCLKLYINLRLSLEGFGWNLTTLKYLFVSPCNKLRKSYHLQYIFYNCVTLTTGVYLYCFESLIS